MQLCSSIKYIFLLFLVLLCVVPCNAQQQTAQLAGRITDTSGAAVPGASVVIADTSRGIVQKTKSNAQGEYLIPLLPPSDHYTLTVTRDGFGTSVQRDLSLQIAQTATVNVALEVGNVVQTVNVSSAPPLLDTQTSSIGQVISEKTIEDLPLNGRSTFRLIALTPGVVFSNGANGQMGDTTVNSTFDTQFRINGGRTGSNEFLIDGIPTATGFFNQITINPIPDETQEFKVESSNLSAEYGRFSGGVINVSTKSGTNEFHGDVFEFLRNSFFDANDWFDDYHGKAIPHFEMNQFGGVIGGPIRISKLYDGRDRTFFFFSYQGTRRIKGTPYTTTVPTVPERTGDFTDRAVTIYNPFSYSSTTGNRNQFPTHNVIPSSLLDPVALAIAKYYPLPNTNGTSVTNNYFNNAPIITNANQYGFRLDQNVTQRYHLFGRYSLTDTSLTQPNQYGNIADGAGSVGTTPFRNQAFAFGNTITINPSMLLTATYGFARWLQFRPTLSYGFDLTSLGFPSSLVSQMQIPQFPAITDTGFGNMGGQSYFKNGNDSHAVLVQLTYVKGRHNIVTGVDGRMHRINFFNVAGAAGNYSFSPQFTRQNNSATAGGLGFASFLLGAGLSGSATVGSGSEMQNFYGAVYVQDNFRVSPRLTVNAGVRYEGESPYLDRFNALNYFDPNVASPAANVAFPNLKGGLMFADTNGTGRSVYTREHLNISPRLGFAFAANPTMVFRASYGISYAPLELTNNGVGTVPNQGYSSTTNWVPGIAVGAKVWAVEDKLSNPFPNGLVAVSGNTQGAATQIGQSLTVWTHNPPTPSNQQWSAGIQQQFGNASLLNINYVGSHNEHLPYTRELNYLAKGYLDSLKDGINAAVANPFAGYVSIGTLAKSTVSQRQLLLPYPQFTSVQEVNDPYGSSSYNALQVSFLERASHGVTLLVSYTWSKNMSNVPAQPAAIGNVTQSTTPQDWGNLAAERSISDMDQPQNLVTSFTAQLPFGRGRAFLNGGGLVNVFVGGWQSNAIWTEQSGFPLTLSVNTNNWGANRVNLVPGQDPAFHGNRTNAQRVGAGCTPGVDARCGWFNAAAFAAPTNYTYGTVRRTFAAVRKPGIQNVDYSMIKHTRINERLDTEFHAQAFNIFNNPHFGNPAMAQDVAGFDVITTNLNSPPPRQLQFALKLIF